MSLIQFSIKRPVVIVVLMLIMSGLGLFCYLQLPRELFPNIEFPIVTVVTTYVGAGPDEIEQLITKKLEEQISMVEGLKHIDCISQQGVSVIVAEFNLEVNVDTAATDVRAKIDLVRSDLPDAAEDPITQKFDFGSQPVVQLAVSAKRPLREVYFYADERIKNILATVPDVASVDILGGEEREIHILTDQQRLRSYDLNISDLIGAIAAANLESPGGYIQQNSREFNIRMRGKFQNLDEIRNLRIPSLRAGGRTVYLRDLAEVRDTIKEIRDKIRANGNACVGINVQKRAGGNTVAVDTAVKEKVKELDKLLPEDFEISIQRDEGPWITSSISNVFENMYIGVILTAITLFVFLHNLRSVIIVSLSMPISLLATFVIMYMSGFTLNMMSLMGLAMTVGVLVNNSILVLENITRYVTLGHPSKVAAAEGSSEIAAAVSSTTLTNIVVFVPIAFMGGIIGQFFKDLGLTATISTMVSLLISFTLTPMMAARLIKREALDVSGRGPLNWLARLFDNLFGSMIEFYTILLKWVLRHPIITLIIVLMMMIGSFRLAGFIGFEFITNMDQGRLSVVVEMPTGTRLEETDQAITRLEETLRRKDVLGDLLVNTYAGIGVTFTEQGGGTQAVNIAQINIKIQDKEQRKPYESVTQVINRIRPKLAEANIPGARIKVFEEGGGGGTGAEVQVAVIGDDMDKLRALAGETMTMMATVPGAIDIDTNLRVGQPEIRIIPDRDKCADCGMTTAQLSQILLAHFEGLVASEYREGAYDYDIRIRSNEQSRKSLDDIQAMTIMTPAGRKPLPELAAVSEDVGPAQLYRRDRQSQITLSCNTEGRTAGEVAAEIETKVKTMLAGYPGTSYAFLGEIESMKDSFARLGMAMIMAICLTYLLLAALLESFMHALIIMSALPLSFIGVFTALFLMGGTLSIFSIMSIIMLLGLVVNNSIVLVDYINVLRGQGKSLREAIIESGRTRLRPIIMADLTTVVAMIPLSLGIGWGGEMQAPMAQVQIGGLLMDSMGLLVTPVLYLLVDKISNLFRKLFHAHTTDQMLLDRAQR